jgi:hypothetical protein
MQEKYGFVYIWRDRKHKRYYIGCHWGTENDGYICSSVWMKNSFFRRPQDFKRRILKRVYSDRKKLFEAESHFLNKIKIKEFGKKYYNLKNGIKHWSSDPEKLEEVREKIKKTQVGKPGRIWTEESKKKLSIKLTGRKLSAETRAKLTEINRGNAFFAGKKHSIETKTLISESKSGKKCFLGKKHSDESRKKMSESAKKRKRVGMPKITCTHCKKVGGANIMKRYHFDNCKIKEKNFGSS